MARARRVTSADFERYDVILAMDRSNLRDLADMAPSKPCEPSLGFQDLRPGLRRRRDPRPLGRAHEGYEETIRMVRAAAKGLVDDLLVRSQAE